MSDLTDRLRQEYCNCIPAYKDRGMIDPQCESCQTLPERREAADELDRLRVQCKMLMDDKAALQNDLSIERAAGAVYAAERDALQSARDVQDAALSVLRNDFRELAAERDALREQLTLAESVRAAQVAGLAEGAQKLWERVEVLEQSLQTAIAIIGHPDDDITRALRAALKGER